ncbi:hypothetical protein ANSO36C_34440 [Nostoc cf. commune SO-36]|uniref:Uncharacterized protein n=1 Tax=Nostoc cf. commune SO-36 TaxID=449208 RepID=A0ABN6Q6M2_NOSCO|nr:hypothetical protein [Nostoc commune]BDI17642.1 hypothetical protein ANSO36C_34440 [Nostoc cf. commune SO-36]
MPVSLEQWVLLSVAFSHTLPGAAGLLGLFLLSGLLRMAALVPLVFVQEQRSMPLGQLVRFLFPIKQSTDLVKVE